MRCSARKTAALFSRSASSSVCPTNRRTPPSPRSCRHSPRAFNATCRARRGWTVCSARSPAAGISATSTIPSTLGDAGTITDGNSILGHIFGSKDVSRQVASQVSAQTGIGESALKAMLPIVAAMMMGSMSKRVAQPGGMPLGGGGGAAISEHADAGARLESRRQRRGRRRRVGRPAVFRTLFRRGYLPARRQNCASLSSVIRCPFSRSRLISISFRPASRPGGLLRIRAAAHDDGRLADGMPCTMAPARLAAFGDLAARHAEDAGEREVHALQRAQAPVFSAAGGAPARRSARRRCRSACAARRCSDR